MQVSDVLHLHAGLIGSVDASMESRRAESSSASQWRQLGAKCDERVYRPLDAAVAEDFPNGSTSSGRSLGGSSKAKQRSITKIQISRDAPYRKD